MSEPKAASLGKAHLPSERESTSKTLLRGVQSQLECPGCNQLYEDPRVLACSHTYCRQCLAREVKKAGIAENECVNCPECGMQTEIPNGDLTQLQYNFFIQHIMDLMSYYSSPEPVPLVYCGMCRKDGVGKLPSAIARCSTCAMFLCKECYELHSIDDFTKLHSTLSITERGDSGFFSCLIPDETGVKNCKKHNWKPFTFFCITCSKAICDNCTKQEHKLHLYARAEDLRPDYTTYIDDLMSRTTRLLRRTESAIRTTQELMSGIQLLAATQIEEVLRTQDILTSALDGRQSILLQEAERCSESVDSKSSKEDSVS